MLESIKLLWRYDPIGVILLAVAVMLFFFICFVVVEG
jgi:hypothetical protein